MLEEKLAFININKYKNLSYRVLQLNIDTRGNDKQFCRWRTSCQNYFRTILPSYSITRNLAAEICRAEIPSSVI